VAHASQPVFGFAESAATKVDKQPNAGKSHKGYQKIKQKKFHQPPKSSK
jgi:hypothetical protein